MPVFEDQSTRVERAFSRQSGGYDANEESHTLLRWMRAQVRTHALNFVRPGHDILELNAGTGTDAVFFAQTGCRVHATDVSAGMLDRLKVKRDQHDLHDRITIQKCSFTELDTLDSGGYDYVFSNFGGLNCVRDLTTVTTQMPLVLKPGGFLTLVMMPPVCPWELALVLRGHGRTAIRRLRHGGAVSHIEGVNFITYYYSPRQVARALGPGFRKIKLQGLASLCPPPYMANFPKRHPILFRVLTALDERLSGLPPFNRWADHFILTLQYRPRT